ncbi:MAG TPA: hypothetical protein DD390_00870 [Rhodospirillaceae bacterium]|nr:hypothetical protein [Rhodospirillaceae bacterium]MAX61877.1 hypothetical protein [Rhodospirillaceae bacterium]HBM11225.1 hypothetical protein [Rhodospirillaceae bacterium]|tara:strand:- start:99795 stop:100091 length:297 start_codon:yes stop_codon:yes gene_type:complete
MQTETTLSAAQTRFQAMLGPYKWLTPYWDFGSSRPEVDADGLQKARGTFSDSEALLAAFFLSVWLGRQANFDMFQAAARLDPQHRALIADWLLDPFWP